MAASGLILSPSAVDALPSQGRLDFAFFDKPIQVFVASSDGGIFSPLLSEGGLIKSVKILIQTFKGPYAYEHMLSHGGVECIAEEDTIKDNELIHFALRLAKLISISVSTVDGTTRYSIHWNDAADDPHMSTSNSHGGCQGVLTLKGERLSDSSILEDIHLDENAVVYLVMQKRIKLNFKFVDRSSMELDMSTGEGNEIFDSVIFKKDSPLGLCVAHRQEGRGLRGASSLETHYNIELSNHPIKCDASDSLRNLLDRVRRGLHAGQSPKLTPEGSGGVYLLKDDCGIQNVAVFKPMDEEPMALNNPRGFHSSHFDEGLKKGTKSGEGAIREVAAYLLDYPAKGVGRCGDSRGEEGFAGVPRTAMVRCFHKAFNYGSSEQMLYTKPKLGSLQQYVNSVCSCEEIGTSMFPVEEVHKITVLDLRLANTDRHAGNILLCRGKDDKLKLVPIDHGYCLPENFEECTFEWLYWPQASQPYGPSTLKYIDALDVEHDIRLLQMHGWNLRCQFTRVLRISTMVLKRGAKAGLTPFQIGCIISRGASVAGAMSPIECIIEEAELKKAKKATEEVFLKIVERLLDSFITQMKAI